MNRWLGAVAVAGVLAAPAAAADPLRPVRASGPLGDERLSNETTLTRLVRPYARASVHVLPAEDARVVDRLHFETEDSAPEIYVALASTVRDGRTWIRLRLPGRPNGRTGWVHRDVVSHFIVRRTELVVSRARLRATLYRGGKEIWSSPVGIGAPGTPTPTGHFWIRERLRGDFGTYGPWAFGTAAYSVLSEWPGGGVIGIHGTNAPGLIPGRPSHGCVRVPNSAILRLARLMPVGTPVRIR